MPTIIAGRPNLHSVAGAKIHEETITKEKAAIGEWWANYRTTVVDNRLLAQCVPARALAAPRMPAPTACRAPAGCA